MKFRMICFGLAALVSLTSGCFYRHHPCFGFRLHPCTTPCGGGQCAPVCSSPIRMPIAHHRPPVGPDCPTCVTAGPIITQPGGYPTSFPPIIGNPSPIPGAMAGPTATELHMPNPMPGKPGGPAGGSN